MPAILEAAAGRQRFDIVEHVVDAMGRFRQMQPPHAGGIEQEPAVFQDKYLPVRGRMAALRIRLADRAGRLGIGGRLCRKRVQQR